MALSGVRSSWLIRDRYSLLAAFARSASALASRRARSARLRSVTSRATTDIPSTLASPSRGAAVRDTLNAWPSARRCRVSMVTRSEPAIRRSRATASSARSVGTTIENGWPTASSAGRP